MFDVMTITRKGLERLAQATAANKLVIVGCDATADFTDAATAATTHWHRQRRSRFCLRRIRLYSHVPHSSREPVRAADRQRASFSTAIRLTTLPTTM